MPQPHRQQAASLIARHPDAAGRRAAPSSPHTGSSRFAGHDHGDWYAHHLNEDRRARAWPRLLGWGAMGIFCVWAVSASAYVLFHDDLLRESARERARLEAVYEDRITRMRSEVDSINGRLMLNQDDFEQKLNRLRARQVLLEQRQGALGEILDQTQTASLTAAERVMAHAGGDMRQRRAEGADEDHASGDASPRHEIRLTFAARGTGSRLATSLGDAGLSARPANAVDLSLMRLARSQEMLEAEQARSLNLLEARTGSAATLIASQLTAFGVEPEPAPVQAAQGPAFARTASIGGPFVPVVMNRREPPAFDQQLHRIRANITHAEQLYRQLLRLPVHTPLKGAPDIVSGFGQRLDPFLRTPALHGGVDFRAPKGTEVLAAARGKVVRAGRHGGYGKLVEIRHADGYTTRYAHLSRIAVAEGERVEAGTVVGRVGSTGRSTGPHLHYEVHAAGEPIDPSGFLKVARTLGL